MREMTVGALVVGALVLAGCGKMGVNTTPRAPAEIHTGRFQLHPAAGGVVGSILIDTSSGQTWMLVPTEQSNVGSVQIGGKPIVWEKLPLQDKLP